jgi:hypothetical protein
MLKRLGILLSVLAFSLLLASPAFAQNSLAERIINTTFQNVGLSPSQSQYGQPGGGGAGGNVQLPAEARRALCSSVVRNRAVPRPVQANIARQFNLSCRPAGSFLDSFFGRFRF